jgi:hypothetical protein
MSLTQSPLARAFIIALGIAAGGLFAGAGFARAHLGDRYVSVKGISEREARADLALWPLRLVVTGNDLAGANARLNSQVQLVRRFLVRQGIDSSLTELQGFSVTDAYANTYSDNAGRALNRYVIHQTIMVRSTDPNRVLAASQQVSQLVQAGVVLSSGGEFGSGGPTFVFTKLNALKPQMIAEATARAREAAEQFAADSHSRLGGIRQASQGLFEILPRDQAPGIQEGAEIAKTIRIVSTVEYSLQ